ncbi:hotdog family protein [Herbaspirillum sp. RTI4]|uniref:hotdog family protein n=1 Tax=Herbaspirillum sp. RTI4 TaxID=3048640 RepID=UPI002AB51621|nr:hotdog family protein [Herbaspirillum sp. RTI4]MDY7578922.1 hotdog family protein [Herbaspirillum sp. RTI4]MEA9982011.1 hotdog family protein [Herbaspirillum sp. RTI4]
MPDVHLVVPHSGAMSLLDRIVEADEKTLCAEVDIHPSVMFYGAQGVGAWIGIEYMAQTIAAQAGYHARRQGEAIRIGFLLGTRRYVAHCSFFAPGRTLQVRASRLLKAENGLGSFDCTVSDKQTQQVLAQAILTVFQPDDAEQFLKGNAE